MSAPDRDLLCITDVVYTHRWIDATVTGVRCRDEPPIFSARVSGLSGLNKIITDNRGIWTSSWGSSLT
jgi:hypothetical protein